MSKLIYAVAIVLAVTAGAHAQDRNGYWYYCGSARGYYPAVRWCPEGWQRIAANPYAADQTQLAPQAPREPQALVQKPKPKPRQRASIEHPTLAMREVVDAIQEDVATMSEAKKAVDCGLRDDGWLKPIADDLQAEIDHYSANLTNDEKGAIEGWVMKTIYAGIAEDCYELRHDTLMLKLDALAVKDALGLF